MITKLITNSYFCLITERFIKGWLYVRVDDLLQWNQKESADDPVTGQLRGLTLPTNNGNAAEDTKMERQATSPDQVCSNTATGDKDRIYFRIDAAADAIKNPAQLVIKTSVKERIGRFEDVGNGSENGSTSKVNGRDI